MVIFQVFPQWHIIVVFDGLFKSLRYFTRTTVHLLWYSSSNQGSLNI